MSEPKVRREELHDVFAEAGFDLEEKTPTAPSRSIGFLAIQGAPSPIVETDLKPFDPPASDSTLRELVTGWESLTPTEFAQRHAEFALEPYIAVGEWVVPIDRNRINAWVDGEYLARALAERPRLETRRIKVQQLRIVYIGNDKAVATYHVVERYEGSPQTYSGNAAVILVHLAKGWRIAAYTKTGSVGT
ncbi:MAG TPA: hypothetical protein VFE33_05990 [Thermoanaerobaculia bacterium]|nr:hypothetical protein [Thermoanaerobaculia bacterium]